MSGFGYGRGAAGFDGRDDAEFAIGTVAGVRVWSMQDTGILIGQYDFGWRDGENVAECRAGHAPPDDRCGCGFWAYWEIAGALVFNPGNMPVIGIVEGYGRVQIGERGFRAAKARIVALCLAFEIMIPREHRSGSRSGDWYDVFDRSEDQPHPDAYAIKARIEDKLGLAYPSARICTTKEIMLALHPPTKDYLPEPEPETDPGSDGWSPVSWGPRPA